MKREFDRLRVAVIFCQFDRDKYSGSVPRLLATLDRLEHVDSKTVIVDNALHGDWRHEVSSDIFHIPGDNSTHEFSAFERGLHFASRFIQDIDAYVFVTDAFRAYGEEYLDLIQSSAILAAVRLRACVGWVDSIGRDVRILGHPLRDYLRTSFLIVPASIIDEIPDINPSIDPETVFGDSAREPFSPGAPISKELQEHILYWLTTNVVEDDPERDRWHSAFELSDETFSRFRNKALCILREQLFSARCRAARIPCYDLRLLDHLVRAGRPAWTVRDLQESWQFLDWRPRLSELKPHLAIERFEAPSSFVHGEEGTLEIEGWVVSSPPIHNLELQTSQGRSVPIACDISRPDVRERFSTASSTARGFSFALPLEFFPPGQFEVSVRIPNTDIRSKAITFAVLPRVEFDVDELLLPQSTGADGTLPFYLRGTLRSSFPPERAFIEWDGQALEVRPEITPQPGADHLYVARIVCSDLLRESKAGIHSFALRVRLENDREESWSFPAPIQSTAEISSTISQWEISGWSPATRSTRVRLRGSLYGALPSDRLFLLRDTETVLEIPLAFYAQSELKSWAHFAIDQSTAQLPPGEHRLELALQPATSSPPRVFHQQATQIALAEPLVHIEQLQVLNNTKQQHYSFRLAGWTTSACPAQTAKVWLNETLMASLTLNRSRYRVQDHSRFGKAVLQGFSYDGEVVAEPGAHSLRVEVETLDGSVGQTERTLTFEPTPSTNFQLFCDEAAALLSPTTPQHFNAIAFNGTVATELRDIVGRLYIDDLPVAECPLGADLAFGLRWSPPSPGTYRVRLLFTSGQNVLFQSDERAVFCQKVALPPRTEPRLHSILEFLGLEAPPGSSVHRLAELLFERHRESFSDLDKLMERGVRSAKRLAADRPPADLPRQPAYEDDARALRVLFAAWEVPCLRHGGGVSMTNQLKHLGARHEITLIHSHGADEVGWVEDVRPYVKRILSIPRTHQSAHYRADIGIPARHYDDYTTALRAAIETELATGLYDLVDYEYTGMLLHMPETKQPSVLVVHEAAISTQLRALKELATSESSFATLLHELLITLDFYSRVLPGRSPNLVALTPDDGEELARLSDANVVVDTIGVDCDLLKPPIDNQRQEDPTFVFLGNYRHPPNVHAAKFFATKVMPLIRASLPDARFLAVGGFSPQEMLDLDGVHGTEIVGFVKDFRPALWTATAFVSPIFLGAGMRVKVLEALAAGSPIIATELSMNGMAAESGVHYVRAETAEEFASAAIRLYSDPDYADRLSRTAVSLARERHDWPVRAAARERIWQQILSADTVTVGSK